MPKDATIITLKRNSKRSLLHAVAMLVASAVLAACSNIDCPLDNVVLMQCGLYASETRAALTLTDTLTVRPAGREHREELRQQEQCQQARENGTESQEKHVGLQQTERSPEFGQIGRKIVKHWSGLRFSDC